MCKRTVLLGDSLQPLWDSATSHGIIAFSADLAVPLSSIRKKKKHHKPKIGKDMKGVICCSPWLLVLRTWMKHVMWQVVLGLPCSLQEAPLFEFRMLSVLRFCLFLLDLFAESRPIDDISTWIQYGESVCWVVADWDECCAPEHGPGGDPKCWVAFPLSYENCCLERWRVCDEVDDSRDRNTPSLSTTWHVFYESCARGQELLNLLQRLWSKVGFQQKLCNTHSQACANEKESVREIWQKLNTQRSAWASSEGWLDVLDEVLPRFNEPDPRFEHVLQKWSPQSFVMLSEITSLESIAMLRDTLQRLRYHLEQFRDSMLDVLYSQDPSKSSKFLACGDICKTESQSVQPVKKQVKCNALLNSMVTNQTMSLPPPSIPLDMMSAYNMNGQVPILFHSTIRQALGFAGGVFPSKEPPEAAWMWTYEAIEKLIAQAYDYKLTPGPNSLHRVKTLTDVLADLPELVRQRHWIVWGDSKHFEWWKPWMESLLLSFGADTVSSIVPEPSRYETGSPHPQLRPVTLQQARWDAPYHGIVLMGVPSAGVGRHGDQLLFGGFNRTFIVHPIRDDEKWWNMWQP